MNKLYLVTMCLGGADLAQMYSFNPFALLFDLCRCGAIISNVTISKA